MDFSFSCLAEGIITWGSQLVERKGRYVTFYGCSRYPACKFTTQ